jgi:hypothetical protein
VAVEDLLDVGTPIGLLQASVELGEHEFGEEFSTWLAERQR